MGIRISKRVGNSNTQPLQQFQVPDHTEQFYVNKDTMIGNVPAFLRVEDIVFVKEFVFPKYIKSITHLPTGELTVEYSNNELDYHDFDPNDKVKVVFTQQGVNSEFEFTLEPKLGVGILWYRYQHCPLDLYIKMDLFSAHRFLDTDNNMQSINMGSVTPLIEAEDNADFYKRYDIVSYGKYANPLSYFIRTLSNDGLSLKESRNKRVSVLTVKQNHFDYPTANNVATNITYTLNGGTKNNPVSKKSTLDSALFLTIGGSFKWYEDINYLRFNDNNEGALVDKLKFKVDFSNNDEVAPEVVGNKIVSDLKIAVLVTEYDSITNEYGATWVIKVFGSTLDKTNVAKTMNRNSTNFNKDSFIISNPKRYNDKFQAHSGIEKKYVIKKGECKFGLLEGNLFNMLAIKTLISVWDKDVSDVSELY